MNCGKRINKLHNENMCTEQKMKNIRQKIFNVTYLIEHFAHATAAIKTQHRYLNSFPPIFEVTSKKGWKYNAINT